MIELSRISKRFGACVALEDVSLSLEKGERVGLVGENGAGKSTLMTVLYGLYRPDQGSLKVDGSTVKFASPRDALARGIGMVQQHFTLVPTLTVAENVVLGTEPTRNGLLDVRHAEEAVAATAKKFGFAIDPAARVDSLTVGSQQKVEIIKALHRGATTLILDEPTAVLTPHEAEELFAVTRALSESGLCVVLISHKLKEVLAFSTRIAVMRRGKKVVDHLVPSDTTPEVLAGWMVSGAAPLVSTPVVEVRAPAEPPAGEPVLRLSKLSAPGLTDVTLTLRPGEILGIAGIDGNGQRELAEVLTGLRHWSSGDFTLFDEKRTSLTPAHARKLGVAHIPEDRLRRALIGDLTVEENVSLGRTHLPPFAKGPLIDFAGRLQKTNELLEAHDVRPREPGKRMGSLSGGNQQKLIVGRELDSKPKLLVVVQPTRGLDISAVKAVRSLLLAEAARGCAVLLISLDLDEVLAISTRVCVMFEGRLSNDFDKSDEATIGRAMLGASNG